MATHISKAPAPVVVSSYALGFIVVCLIVYILHEAAAILIPFTIAVFVWYLLNAMARGLMRVEFGAKRHIPRFFCFLFSILIMVGGLWFIYKLISVNGIAVARAAPFYQAKTLALLDELLSHIPEDVRPNRNELAGYLDIGAFLKTLVSTFTGIAGKTMVVLFYTGFLLYEQRFFGRKLEEIMSEKKSEARFHKTLKNIEGKIQRYIWVKTLISVLTGVSTWLLLKGFHVSFAEFWGVMAFIFHFIPFAGSIAAVLLPGIAALAELPELASLLMLVTGLSAVQIFFTSFLDPRMMGDSLNLSPIFIISAIAAWGVIWGVPGMFLAVPILSAAVIILSQFDRTRPFAILMSKTGEIEGHDSPAGARH